MRRVSIVASLALLMIFSLSAEAQRGGRMSGGGHSMPSGMRGPRGMGFRPGPGGFRSGPASFRPRPGRFPARPVFFGPSRFGHSSRVFFGPGFRHHGPFFFDGFRRRRFFFNGCFGPFVSPFACQSAFFFPTVYPGLPFWYDAPYVYAPPPAYDISSTPSYPADATYAADQNYESNVELRREVDRLSDEVDSLRQERLAASAPRIPEVPEPPTLLIFRNGTRQQVQNYGIAGQTLWIFDEQHARKVPKADLDVAATQEANTQRGVTFRWP